MAQNTAARNNKQKRNGTKRIGKKNVAIGNPTGATKNGESMEDLHEAGSEVGVAHSTDDVSVASSKPNRKRFGMVSPPGSPVLAQGPPSPPSPTSTLASFRFGHSAPPSKPASPTRKTPPPVEILDDSADIVPDVIQFRSPLSKQSSRVLYDAQSHVVAPPTRTYMPGSSYFDSRRRSSASTASWVHTPASDARRPSLVNPEDYLPGLPASANAGKAMAAGFEPNRPAALHSAIPIGRRNIPAVAEENAPATPVPDLRNLRIPSTELEFDLGDLSQESIETGYDASQIYGADKNEEEVNAMVVPTLYSNSYTGPAAMSFHAAEKKAKSQQDRFTSLNTSLPRDASTGKIDWRARLQVGPGKKVTRSPEIRFMEKNPGWNVSMSTKGFAHSQESFDEKSYTSEKPSPNIISLQDDSYSRVEKFLLGLSPVTYVVAQGAMVFYLYKRCSYILEATNETGNKFVGAWLFFAFEAFFALMTFTRATYHLFTLKLKNTPKYTIKGDIALPTVDVLVLSTGQEVSMVMDATIAAARLDWPVDKLRVLVIDETGSGALEKCVESYAHTRAIHVTYHKRSRQSMYNRDANPGFLPKSSTINFGLTETRAEGRISGEYTVVLEAESIAENDMLRVLLPHMVKNPLAALVRTPGGFYNLPKSLGGSFGTFLRCVEPKEDARSGFVLRRSAIDDVGGFPTRSSIEDGRLEALLQGRGYKAIWAADTVQYSMVPDSFSSHLRQRVDRKLSHIGSAFRLGLFFLSTKLRYMPFGARLRGLGRAILPFASIFVFLNMVAFPVAVLYDRGFLIPALSLSELNITVWAALGAVVAERLHDFCTAFPSGQVSARRFIQSEVFMAPYTILGMLRKLVPSFLRRMPEPYWTPAEFGEPKERDPKSRQSLGRRLLSSLLFTHGWVHLFVISGILASVGYSLFHSIRPYALHQRSLHQTGLLILMTVAWPTLPWMNVLLGSLVPFIYALFPPSVPNRERLLYREPISTVARPLQDRKRTLPLKERFFGQFLLSAVLVGYVFAVFALTFIDLHVK